MRKTNKMIFYFSDYGIEVYQIVAIEEDSLKLELFDDAASSVPVWSTIVYSNIPENIYISNSYSFEIDTVTGPVEAGSIVIADPGSRYSVGDVCTINAGNQDATFTITGVNDPGAVQPPIPAPGQRGAPQKMSDMLSNIGNVTSSLTSALNFKNIMSNVFPFELPPIQAISDYYTLARGGGGQPDQNLPSNKAVADRATGDPTVPPTTPKKKFLVPPSRGSNFL